MGLFPGYQIDEFQIVRPIGRGGFGEVYLAYDKDKHRTVAIKQYNTSLSSSTEGIHRFLQEAKIIESLHHPNIVSFYGLRKWSDNYYIIMEFVEGGSLRDLLNQGKKFSIEEVVYIGKAISQALMKVHELGVIHRDIKPENILMTLQGLVKVSDFGISLMAQETGGTIIDEKGQMIGTLLYMSPEQITGGPVSRLTDLYAVGIVLYELLAGKPWIDIAEVKHQAKLLASPGTSRYWDVIRDLLATAINSDKEDSFKDISGDVPNWLRLVVSNAINQRITMRGVYESLKKKEQYFNEIEKSKQLSEHEFIKNLKLALRRPFQIPSEFHAQLIALPWGVVDNLNIYIVVESKDKLNYLDQQQLKNYSISREKAFQVALQNLETETEQLTPYILRNEHGEPIAAYYENGGEMDASRILLLSARRSLCQALQVDTCIAAIPDSNIFIACIPDQKYIKSLSSQARKQYITRPHPVTDKIFQINIHGDINPI